MRVILLALLAATLSGCGASLTNLPWSAYAEGYVDVPRLRVHVDEYGDFYPRNWHLMPGEAAVSGQTSLREALALNGHDPDQVVAYRDAAMADVRRAVQGRSRVFVLIHGFNAEVGSAGAGYAVIDQLIPFDRDRDLVIEMHWDGLRDSGRRLNGAKIWFPAAATSQMAGSRALRAMLAKMHDAQVVLISHSRGASVILSAFGNPSYEPRFRRSVVAAGIPAEYFEPSEIDFSAKNLRIDAIMLAAAVGNPDFWDQKCAGLKGCRLFRPLTGLSSIRHSVNPGDPILSKRFIPFLNWSPTCGFNATTLGYTADCGDWVRDYYGSRLVPYPIEPMKTHSFVCYAGHPVLRRMLADIGVDTYHEQTPALPPIACRNG